VTGQTIETGQGIEVAVLPLARIMAAKEFLGRKELAHLAILRTVLRNLAPTGGDRGRT
jgi:hypothetical protein